MRISGKKGGLGSCFGEFGGGSSGQREIVWGVLITPSCPTLCNPMDCSPLDSSVCGIVQARILEWVDIPFSRGSSQTRDRTLISCTAGIFFTVWAPGEPQALNSQRSPFLTCFTFIQPKFFAYTKLWVPRLLVMPRVPCDMVSVFTGAANTLRIELTPTEKVCYQIQWRRDGGSCRRLEGGGSLGLNKCYPSTFPRVLGSERSSQFLPSDQTLLLLYLGTTSKHQRSCVLAVCSSCSGLSTFLGSATLMASPCTSVPAICLCCPSPLGSRLTILPPLGNLPTCTVWLSLNSSCSHALYFGSGPPDPRLFRPRPWSSPWMCPVSAPPSDLVTSLHLFAVWSPSLSTSL